MGDNRKIQVQDVGIRVTKVLGEDYICVTDMIKAKDGDFVVSDWLRNRNTLEFLAVWEQMNNPDFNYGEFALITTQIGLNGYKISVKDWVSKTNAIGLVAKAGRYGGTYAHEDIATEFGTWISPQFKLWLIREFKRLKKAENNQYSLEWNVKRVLSKVNYKIHTDAVQQYIIPTSLFPKDKQWIEYANEADLLNVAMFGYTAKEWKESNPEQALKGKNIRDTASINELTVLSNIESMNAEMIRTGVDKHIRFNKLKEVVSHQLTSLNNVDFVKSLKYTTDTTFTEIDAPKEDTPFNRSLKKAITYNPKDKK